jgi:hypothetical protein
MRSLAIRAKRVTVASAALVLALASTSAAQEHIWSQLLDNPNGHDTADAVATDSAGNIFVAGEFTDDLVLGNTTLDSRGSTDTFLIKLSPAGNLLWVASIGSIGPDEPAAITVDASGNAYVTGRFSSTADFGGTRLTARLKTDMFVAAYAANNGALLWARGYGSAGTEGGTGIAFTSDNNLVVTGYFQDSIDFGGGALTSAGSYDIVLLSLTPQNGAYRWATRYGRQFSDQPDTLAADAQGRVFIAGHFDSQTDVGTGTIQTSGATDSFIAGYSAQDGHALWARQIGGTGFDVARAVTVTPDGKVVVVGYYGLSGGSVDFGNGPVPTYGGADTFLAAYQTTNGALAWSRGYGGPYDDQVRSIDVDASGTLSIAGYFTLETDMGGGPLPSRGQLENFLARYTSNGDYLWSQSYGGILGDEALGISIDPAGNMIVVGFIGFDVDFGGGLLYAQGWASPFIVKLAGNSVPPTATSTPTRTPTPTRTIPPTATRTPTPAVGSLSITGRVTYYSNVQPVPGVDLTLSGPQGRTMQTTGNGDYAFTNLTSGSLSIEPTNFGDRNDAVSGLDAAYVLQAVTGLRQLTQDQLLACDVTGNGDLSSLDAAKILQFLVGTVSGFPVADACGSDWLFAPTAVPMSGQSLLPPIISSGDCRRGSIAFNPLTVSAQGQSFKAILFGDCTGNWSAPGGTARQALATRSAQVFAGRARRTRCGKIAVPIFVRADSFNSAQITLRYDSNLTPVGARPASRDSLDVLVTQSSPRPGIMEVALASGRPLRGGRLLYVDFEAGTEPAAPGSVTVVDASVDESAALAARGLPRR